MPADLQIRKMSNLLASLLGRVDKLERYASTGRFLPYTPALTASTTSPTLGAGSALGVWSRHGNWVYAKGIFTFGAGMTAGSGTYRISVPVAARVDPIYLVSTLNLGHVRLAQAGLGGTVAHVHDLLFTDNVSYFTMRYANAAPTGVDTAVTQAAPWAWASGHSLQFQVLYEAYE